MHEPGSSVTHAKYGPGVVVSKWGSWFSCRCCIAEVEVGSVKMLPTSMSMKGADNRMRLVMMKCPTCQQMMVPIHVNAKEVAEVRFSDGQVRPINEVWLKPSVRLKFDRRLQLPKPIERPSEIMANVA